MQFAAILASGSIATMGVNMNFALGILFAEEIKFAQGNALGGLCLLDRNDSLPEALIDETGRIANMSQEEKVVPSLEYNDIPLLPHTTVEIQRVTVRIVAHDVYFSDNTVPMYAEILSEDNR